MSELDDFLAHEGVARRSGRYPWGSGENPNQRNKSFLNYVDDLSKKGLSEAEIAKGMDISVTKLRAYKSMAKTQERQADQTRAQMLKEKGHSNVAIGEMMGKNESSVRALLDPAMREKNDILETTSRYLKDQIAEKQYLDVGAGVEQYIGVSRDKLQTAIAMLEDEGYVIHNVQVPQLGTNNKTTVKVLAPEGTTYKDIVSDQSKINTITGYSEDGGRSFLGIEPPKAIDPKRVGVRYADEGGADMDGVIQLRRGVDDISLGNSQYAQVRIQVGDGHFLKGMAMYADNLPDGVDMVFNTNKKKNGDDTNAMKKLKDDEDNPFGSVVRQKHFLDANGKRQLSILNIVGSEDPDGNSTSGEEGGWSQWSNKLSSQMLSKQSPVLAKQQLGLSYDIKKAEFDEIMALNNPAVKKTLLNSFSDAADSAAVRLQAAGLPRTANHVILPINSLKDTEIYAPKYRNGEKVVLIRHPHGGKFEIPELTVNNRNKEANSVMKQAADAVGINSKVAARLSGADFDGDTVLVIPNGNPAKRIQNSAPLGALKNFDPQIYKMDDDAPKMSPKTKQQQMGDVSNLITDMTVKGAPDNEIARAVRHSMVVIDAEKHHLNYKQSALDNNIKELKTKYQGKSNAGASTVISRASSEIRVADRRAPKAGEGPSIDPKTGKKIYIQTGEGYEKTWTTKSGQERSKWVDKTVSTTRMAEVDDAHKLSSGKTIEKVYADHANSLKALANAARKEMVSTPPVKYNPSAKKVYEPQVKSLTAKLNVALKNAPRERQALLLGNTIVKAKVQANPDMDPADLKKIKGQALTEARRRAQAGKTRVHITNDEWAAIQAGAISNNMLEKVLRNSDLDQVKALATPRDRATVAPAKLSRAKSMLASGYTQAEIADQLGIAVSTLNDAILGKEG